MTEIRVGALVQPEDVHGSRALLRYRIWNNDCYLLVDLVNLTKKFVKYSQSVVFTYTRPSLHPLREVMYEHTIPRA